MSSFSPSSLLAAEGGYRLGRFMKPRTDETARSVVFNIHAAILGLLGLLLAFTFSMAVARYEMRKQLVLDEANTIGTAYLRARLLPEPQRTDVARLFQEYVDARLQFHQEGEGPDGRREDNDKADRLQDQLWARAVAAGESDPRSVTTGLFIQALNDVIDVRKAPHGHGKPRAGACVVLSLPLRRPGASGPSGMAAGWAAAGTSSRP